MTMGKTRFSEDGRRAVSQAQRKRWSDPLRSSESAIQEAIFEHYRHRRRPGAVMFHVPNGGLRPSHVGAKLRAQGVQPGAPDLVCCVDGRFYGLELKSERGTISRSQREFGRHLEFAGGTYQIARGLDQALACLEEWGVRGKRAHATHATAA